MKAVLALFLGAVVLFQNSITQNTKAEITCSDLRDDSLIGAVLFFTSNEHTRFSVSFFLSTKRNKDPALITTVDWSALQTHAFDPFQKTYIIIHGYKNNANYSWVLEMKDELLEAVSTEKHFT